ncbi:hypothetical protein SLA2020_376440 [Shorea laevis]
MGGVVGFLRRVGSLESRRKIREASRHPRTCWQGDTVAPTIGCGTVVPTLKCVETVLVKEENKVQCFQFSFFTDLHT